MPNFIQYRKYLPPDILMFFTMLVYVYLYVSQQQFIYYRVCLLVKGGNCSITRHNETYNCTENPQVDHIQSLSSYLLLISTLVTSIPSIFTSLFLGPLTDLVGRKVAFFSPIITMIISMLILLSVDYLDLSPYFILISSAVTGVGGSYTIIIMALSAYIVDTVSEKNRAIRLSILEAVISAAAFAGNLSGGLILEAIGFSYFFILNIILLAIILVYAILMKESIQVHVNFSKISINRKLFYKSAKIFSQPFRLFCANTHPFKFIAFLSSFTFILTAVYGNFDLFTIYALAPPMCWLPHLIGYYFAFSYLGSSIGLALIVPILVKLKVSENIIIILSALDIMGIYVLVGTFQIQWLLLILVPIIGCMRLVSAPAIKSALSGLIAPEDRGSLFALFTIQSIIVQIIASLVLNATYPTLRLIHPGMSFYIVSVGSAIPIVLVIAVYVYDKCVQRWRRISSGLSTQISSEVLEKEPLLES